MPKLWPIQTNFTGGQISSSAWGRVDAQRYAGSVREMTNVTTLIQGGCKFRPGISYVRDATLNNLSGARLVPFVFNSEAAYILEFSPNQINIIRASGSTIPTVITTPYVSTVDIDELKFAQYQNTLVVTHKNYAPRRLQRFSDTLWRFEVLPISGFNMYPQAELGQRPAATLSLSATTGVITLTASAGVTFLASDVGRQVRAGAGLATITAYASGTSVTATVIQTFETLSYPSQSWAIYDTPLVDVTPSVKTLGDTCVLTASSACWRSTLLGDTYSDIGSFVWINDGIVEITSVTSATVAGGIVRRALSSIDKSFGGAWQLKLNEWSNAFGWPKACAIFENRLVFGGSASFPNTFWMSQTGNVLNYAIGVNASDPIEFTLGSDRSDEIRHIVSNEVLYFMTYGSEYTATGSDNGSITPTSIMVRRQSTYGSSDARPPVIGPDVYILQRSGKKIRRIVYELQTEAYSGEDITVLADDIMDNFAGGVAGIKSMAYAQEPDSILWCVTNDNRLIGCNADRDTGIFAWHQHESIAEFVDVAAVPYQGEDRVFFIAKNPNDVNYIGYFDSSMHLDWAGIGGGLPSNQKLIAHLANETASCVADGVYVGEITADGFGVFTLPVECSDLWAGIKYDATVELLPVEFPLNGSIQGRGAAVSRTYVRVKNTETLTIESIDAATGAVRSSQQILPRSFGGAALTNRFNEFTGDLETSLIGWEKSQPRIQFKQTVPLPFTILAIVKVLSVND